MKYKRKSLVGLACALLAVVLLVSCISFVSNKPVEANADGVQLTIDDYLNSDYLVNDNINTINDYASM